MKELRWTIFQCFLVFCCSLQPLASQTNGAEVSKGKSQAEAVQNGLQLGTIGQEKLPSGNVAGFRDYIARDGSTARIVYTKYASLEGAKKQINDWTKIAQHIITREEKGNSNTQRIDDRIVAVTEIPKANKKENVFIIIRRDGLSCYFIQGPSLALVLKVESMIEHK